MQMMYGGVPVLSEGQRMLLELTEPLAKMGPRLNVTEQAISLWRTGERSPVYSARLRLEAVYKIPIDAWTQLPKGDAPPLRRRAGRPPKPRPEVSPEAPPKPARGRPKLGKLPALPDLVATPDEPGDDQEAPDPEVLGTTMEGIAELLRAVRRHRARPGLIASEQVKLTDVEARLLTLRHRLEKDAELLEGRIVNEHPRWTQIREVIATTLAKWPDAARAVAEALRGMP